MPVSTSPGLNGYVLDTNVLSRLAKINRLELLSQLATVPLYITPAIQAEIETGLENGVSYLVTVLQLIKVNKLQVMPLLEIDRQFMRALPAKL